MRLICLILMDRIAQAVVPLRRAVRHVLVALAGVEVLRAVRRRNPALFVRRRWP
jgi:hypothetical protein